MDKCYECDNDAELGICKKCYGLLSGGPIAYREECKQLRSQLKDAEEVVKLLENMLDHDIIDTLVLYGACANYRQRWSDEG